MAPSNMFSYLRPGHAKRNASSLASPEPIQSPAAYPLPSPSQNTEYFTSPRLPDNASFASNSPISPFPPQLPPITRVASKLDKSPSAARPGASASRPAPATAASSSQISLQHGMLSPGPAPEGNPPSTQPTTTNAPSHLSTISPSYTNLSRSQTSLMSGMTDKLSGASKTSSTTTPIVVPPKGKSRLNLRNPMSLLMRRRSGQTLDPLSDQSLVSHRDNFDPSIRGHIVHDFNAPRVKRNFSHNNAYGSDEAQQDLGRVSPPKIDREHTPVFREHFDDDTSYKQSQAAIRAEQLANKDFLARNSVQLPPPTSTPPLPPPVPKDPPPPPLPKDPPSILPYSTSSPPSRSTYNPSDSLSNVLSPVQESPDPPGIPAETTPRQRKSTKTPPVARSRATSVTDPSFQPAGLPTHFTSRASRFSFQISGGSDSAEEAILEERHKQKAAEKASKQVRMSTNTLDDEYDDYGMDDYDMDGGFEEEIPMLGEEDEFEGLGGQSMESSMNNFDFSSLSILSNLNDPASSMHQMGQLQTPIDANGNPIGFAMSEGMLQQYQQQMSGGHPIINLGDEVQGSQPALQDFSQLHSNMLTHGTPAIEYNQNQNDIDFGDDDMYFDDGLIGAQDEYDAAEFDENVFDDPDGPLYERKVKPPPVNEIPNALASHPPEVMSFEIGYEADGDALNRHLDAAGPSLAHKTSVVQQSTLPDFNNMEAYHSALADAATRAEAAGRFTRTTSINAGRPNSDVEDLSSLSNSRPSLVPDDGRVSLENDIFPIEDDIYGMTSSFVDDYEYSDFETGLEDDPMIAAANAEALAFDDEGFYGQEFGFYASAIGDSANAWGGFFGPSGLGRTVSGRNAVREPNLTPITERSEYSTRNSFISLNQFRSDGQQPISSPGLAQLARMSPYGWPEEEDMSLDTLLKLRKGAFGGSAANSTPTSPRNSSPMGMQFVPRISTPAGNRMKEHTDSESGTDESAKIEAIYGGLGESNESLTGAVNATRKEVNDNEDYTGEDIPEGHTLMTSDYTSLSDPEHDPKIQPQPPGSAADSVAYVRDHDEAGEGRWILERRRTAESGELELVGREIVEGGRI
ncbi:hypothetical protein GQ44DRAFT_672627 [Phaeosphaeriaceae sp. PMI808]|nr:hypothetical protein GQ44DRAFT_672627 [Phaeosphaeriaceae sp. PMI808]